MPIYEYTCTKCKHSLEALQKLSDAPLTKCPACGKNGLAKLISAASFRLKGGGWYETDFKTGDKKQLADSDSGNAAGSDKEDKAAKPETATASPADKSKGDTAKAAPKPAGSDNSKPGKASKTAAKKKTRK